MRIGRGLDVNVSRNLLRSVLLVSATLSVLVSVLVSVMLGVTVGWTVAHAAGDEDDFQEPSHRVANEAARRKSYPGARDEQSLEVQAVLPQPSRSPDGGSTMAIEGVELPETPPASD